MVPMHLPKTVIKLPVRVMVEVEAPEPFTAERLTERAPSDDSLQRRLAQAEDMIAWLVAPADDAAEAELAALRARVAELEQAPLLPAPDALLSDWGDVGETYDDITGDMLLDAFELDEAETAAVVQTLSATRLRHLSEQLNVERASLDRMHQATGIANPRSASIDRLLGLLTRRGEI